MYEVCENVYVCVHMHEVFENVCACFALEACCNHMLLFVFITLS